MCPCAYTKYVDLKDLKFGDAPRTYNRNEDNEDFLLLLAFVDDFLCTGTKTTSCMELLQAYRTHAPTTEPIINADKFLGMEIERDRERRIILVRVQGKIMELCEEFWTEKGVRRNVPMPKDGYIVQEHEIESLSPSMVKAFSH